MTAPIYFYKKNAKAHLKLVRQRERLNAGAKKDVLLNRVKKVTENNLDRAHAQMLVDRIINSTDFLQALAATRELLAYLSSISAEIVACKKGCSHCCVIPVAVSNFEAQQMAKELGIRASTPTALRTLPMSQIEAKSIDRFRTVNMRQHGGTPCTFLTKDGQCTIYDSRPVACRQQFSADDDALLCILVEGEEIEVPYLDFRVAETALSNYFIYSDRAAFDNCAYADIRDWFPNGLKTT